MRLKIYELVAILSRPQCVNPRSCIIQERYNLPTQLHIDTQDTNVHIHKCDDRKQPEEHHMTRASITNRITEV